MNVSAVSIDIFGFFLPSTETINTRVPMA
jgi:hypothetical protein